MLDASEAKGQPIGGVWFDKGTILEPSIGKCWAQHLFGQETGPIALAFVLKDSTACQHGLELLIKRYVGLGVNVK